MRRLILLGAIALVAVAAGSATAKTVIVTITKNGYVPSSTTIAQGDTVQFTNSDTVVHQVTFKSTTGVTCTPNPLVVQPAASGTCTFQNAGSYTYSDPNVKGNTFRGTVVVTAAPVSLTLTAKPLLVVYGGSSTLSGVLSTQKVGENIDVFAQQCGASAATKLITVPTTTGGAFTTAVKPLSNTAYTAKDKSVSSPAVTVRVRPSVRLAKVAAHRFSLRVSAGTSFAGKYASFQRYNGTLRRWVAVKSVLLKASSTGAAPTVVSAASFRSTVASGRRVRATLPQAQVGGCYAPGTSNTILS
ncbi:MAG: cupredoxin domain-containing protein [Gaiellaceae bacterium]